MLNQVEISRGRVAIHAQLHEDAAPARGKLTGSLRQKRRRRKIIVTLDSAPRRSKPQERGELTRQRLSFDAAQLDRPGFAEPAHPSIPLAASLGGGSITPWTAKVHGRRAFIATP